MFSLLWKLLEIDKKSVLEQVGREAYVIFKDKSAHKL